MDSAGTTRKQPQKSYPAKHNRGFSAVEHSTIIQLHKIKNSQLFHRTSIQAFCMHSVDKISNLIPWRGPRMNGQCWVSKHEHPVPKRTNPYAEGLKKEHLAIQSLAFEGACGPLSPDQVIDINMFSCGIQLNTWNAHPLLPHPWSGQRKWTLQ